MTPARFDQIDWPNWKPQQRATLTFVIRDGQILLIHKKRGLGAGKINGPGGRLDPGETPLQCAIREVQEELHVTPTGLQPAGQLFFQFTDGLTLHGYVYTAADITGTPQETDEAIPLWLPLDRIPYERMWADDHTWLPHVLAGKKFIGRYLFSSDTMLGHDIEISTHWKKSWPDFS
jgi:8-oxo-dGTP diphosphatase